MWPLGGLCTQFLAFKLNFAFDANGNGINQSGMDWNIVQYPNTNPNGKVHGANTGPTCVQLAPDGPHDGPMNLAIGELYMCD